MLTAKIGSGLQSPRKRSGFRQLKSTETAEITLLFLLYYK